MILDFGCHPRLSILAGWPRRMRPIRREEPLRRCG